MKKKTLRKLNFLRCCAKSCLFLGGFANLGTQNRKMLILYFQTSLATWGDHFFKTEIFSL